MFGFGNDKNEKKVDSAKETSKWSAINATFGTTDVDEVLKQYMPELSGAILTSSKFAVQINDNQIKIADSVLSAIEELKKQNEEALRKNR